MPDVRTLIRDAMQQLGERADAEALLLHLLGHSRSWLIAHDTDVLPSNIVEKYSALVARRVEGEPIAYITGHRGFWSLDLEVSPATLIPRADTERLVELALERLPRDRVTHVADLGTGSGAIALAIAHERPNALVTATDASVAALDVAKRNATRHRLERVTFKQGSWLVPLVDQTFDVIVSNPPYIEQNDAHLSLGDLRYEPMSALVSGDDGLDDIRQIVADARSHLRVGGWLLMEHGWNQGDAVRSLLRAAGYDEAFTAQDIEQRDRVSGARWSSPSLS